MKYLSIICLLFLSTSSLYGQKKKDDKKAGKKDKDKEKEMMEAEEAKKEKERK